MFCLHMLKYFLLLPGLVGAVGAVVAGKVVDSHFMSVDDSILLCFESAAIKITVNILILLQVNVLDVLLQGTSILGLVFTLVAGKSDVLVLSFVMLLEA